MLQNTTNNTHIYKKVNNLFSIIQEGLKVAQEGLKVANEVYNITARTLTLQTHDLQDKWSQNNRVKGAPQNNNITTLMQQILNLCSKVVDFLTGIKKYLTDLIHVNKIIITLKQGMQYCSQLLSGTSKYKSNDMTTPAAAGNSADSQNVTSPSQSTDTTQASTTTPAQTNSTIPNRTAENIQSPASDIINNTRADNNLIPPPPPPLPASAPANSSRSVNHNHTPASPQPNLLEEIQSKIKSKANTNSQNAILPSQSTDTTQASTTTPAQTNSTIPNRTAENIQSPASDIINNTRADNNLIPPPPPSPPPSSLANSIHNNQFANKYKSNKDLLTDESKVILNKRRAAYSYDDINDDNTIDDDLKNQYNIQQIPDNTSNSATLANNTAANPGNLPIPTSTQQNLLVEIRAGHKLKPTLNNSTNQKPSLQGINNVNPSIQDKINQVAEKHNSYFTPSDTVEDWETDADRDIQNTDTLSWKTKISQTQSSPSNCMASTPTSDKKQTSYIEQENKKRTLSKTKQHSKSRS